MGYAPTLLTDYPRPTVPMKLRSLRVMKENGGYQTWYYHAISKHKVDDFPYQAVIEHNYLGLHWHYLACATAPLEVYYSGGIRVKASDDSNVWFHFENKAVDGWWTPGDFTHDHSYDGCFESNHAFTDTYYDQGAKTIEPVPPSSVCLAVRARIARLMKNAVDVGVVPERRINL